MAKLYQVFVGCPFRRAIRKNYDKLKTLELKMLRSGLCVINVRLAGHCLLGRAKSGGPSTVCLAKFT